MSRKERPRDGPGANGLRGGRNVYLSGKTAIGVWLDEKGGPSGYKRGFTTNDFQTEGQLQQIGYLEKQPRSLLEFGAELPPPDLVHRKPPATADLFDSTYSGYTRRDWLSNTEASMRTGRIPKDERMKVNITREKLEEYRKTWTTDTPASRIMRFQTENRRQGNAANKLFQTATYRLLPGTPMVLEKYRERLLQRFGVLGLTVLRYTVGQGVQPVTTFRASLVKAEVALTAAEANQIIAFFTPSDNINVDQFLRMVAARPDNFNDEEPRALWARLFGSTTSKVALFDVVGHLSDAEHADVSAGLREFLPAYCDDDGMLSIESFILLHSDLYACSNVAFAGLLGGLWRTEPADDFA